MWCRSAVNRSFLSFLAAGRTRSSALGAMVRPGVRVAFCCRRFPSVKPLPSSPSASAFPELFGDFSGVGSEEARVRASLRPPLKLHGHISRKQLSRRLTTVETQLRELIQRG